MHYSIYCEFIVNRVTKLLQSIQINQTNQTIAVFI